MSYPKPLSEKSLKRLYTQAGLSTEAYDFLHSLFAACACCCRGCLHKWYHVPVGRELTENEQERIVKLLMAWIERQLDCDTR